MLDVNIQITIEQCSNIQTPLMLSLIKKESNFKQYAIGMDVRNGWVTQPKSLKEAKKTIDHLRLEGRSFSLGYAQIHISNIERFGLNLDQAFDPCINIHTSELILKHYYSKSLAAGFKGYIALFATLRGYNTGYIGSEVGNKYASSIINEANLTNYTLTNSTKYNAQKKSITLKKKEESDQ